MYEHSHSRVEHCCTTLRRSAQQPPSRSSTRPCCCAFDRQNAAQARVDKSPVAILIRRAILRRNSIEATTGKLRGTVCVSVNAWSGMTCQASCAFFWRTFLFLFPLPAPNCYTSLSSFIIRCCCSGKHCSVSSRQEGEGPGPG